MMHREPLNKFIKRMKAKRENEKTEFTRSK